MARASGTLLLAALRQAKSKSALIETPDIYFEEGQERNAYVWLRDYVLVHNAFPNAATMARETGLRIGLTPEPLSYYQNDARQKVLFEALFEPFSDIRQCMEDKTPDQVIDIMKRTIAHAQTLQHRREGLTTLAQSTRMIEEDYQIARRSEGLRGIPTGWDYTDELTDGYQNSDVITVVGRPGRGKTMILLKKALAAHAAGYKVLFLSMEMGVLPLARRFYGLKYAQNPKFIRRGELSSYQQAQFYRNLNIMAEDETPFHWLAGNFKKTVPSLRSAAYECEPDIIFADASYLMKPETGPTRLGGRREVIGEVIEQIGSMTKDLNRACIQSVQFNRQGERPARGAGDEDRRNPVSHLSLAKIGETDVVGQVSAIVYGLDYGETPNEKYERYLGILKGREGEEGWLRIHYRFQPVDLSEITNSSRHRYSATAGGDDQAPDLTYMDAVIE